jgi:hypothetical protein
MRRADDLGARLLITIDASMIARAEPGESG